MILPQKRYFGVALTGLRVTGLQIRGYVFDMATPSIYYRNTNAAPSRIDFFVRLTVSAVEAPKVTQISLSDR